MLSIGGPGYRYPSRGKRGTMIHAMLARLLAAVILVGLLQPLQWLSGTVKAAPPDPSAAAISLLAFGQNDRGQLGLGHTTDQSVPAAVDVGAQVRAVAASGNFTLFVTEGGDALSTGNNNYGQLGLGDTTTRHTPQAIAGIADAVDAAAGRNHSLVLTGNGDVYSFGLGVDGRLGHGNANSLNAPVKIAGLPPAKAVAAGGSHSLVLTVTGEVYGFGSNNFGQLGLGKAVSSAAVPTKLAQLPPIAAISAGTDFSLLLTEAGDVYSFGLGVNGQLGLGASGEAEIRYTPVRISALDAENKRIRQIEAGGSHALLLTEDGEAYAFGLNGFGQLGLGDTLDRTVPTKVAGLPKLATIAAGGYHSFAMGEDGALYAFGYDSSGQLGDRDTESQLAPVRIKGLWNIQFIEGGSYSSFVSGSLASLISPTEAIFEKYEREQQDIAVSLELNGNALTAIRNGATELVPGTDYVLEDGGTTAIVKKSYLAALGVGAASLRFEFNRGPAEQLNLSVIYTASKEKRAFGFGDNAYGQLGQGDSADRSVPAAIDTPADITAVAAGSGYTFWLTEAGALYVGGWNANGELGIGGGGDRNVPQPVSALQSVPVKSVASGYYHTFVVSADGDVYGFGVNSNGQLGFSAGTTQNIPVRLGYLPPIAAAATGMDHSLLLSVAGEVYAAGSNQYGQLGLGQTASSSSFVKIPGLPPIKAVAAGQQYSLLVAANGDVYAFGRNQSGQLGLGHTTDANVPTLIEAMDKPVKAVAAGATHALLLTEDGKVYAVGSGNRGQLGQGTTASLNVPTVVTGAVDAASVAAGRDFSLFTTNNGQVYSFGLGNQGQLGHGDTANRLVPEKIAEMDGYYVKSVAAGAMHAVLTIAPRPARDSAISPTQAPFDKNPPNQTDIAVVLNLNGNALTGIANVGTALQAGTDYTLSADTVTIHRSYLSGLSVGFANLTFTFSAGTPQSFVVDVTDSTPVEPTATPSATPTATPSVTPTPTPSATPTSTPSATPTSTPSATPTSTPSATPTSTPTPSATPTSTPSATPTSTPSETPTPTPITPPGAPTSVTATAGVKEATVSFGAPSEDGGSAITGYRVVSAPDGVEATGSDSPITVPGLREGVSYTFTVQAINAAGNGPMSAPSNAVTPDAPPVEPTPSPATPTPSPATPTPSPATPTPSPGTPTSSPATPTPPPPVTVPGAPTGVTATAGVKEATVSFVSPAADGGSPITGYRVVSAPDGVEATGSGSPITVTGLRASVSYTFTVQAINAAGSGPMSEPSYAVTLETAPGSNDSPSLSDMTGHWAKEAVERAVTLGFVTGYPDGTFRPDANVTRQEIAAILIRSLPVDTGAAPPAFRDAGAIGDWASEAVGQVAALGLMVGYGDGTFRPSERLTRSELAVLIRRARELNDKKEHKPVDPAMPASYADEDAIPPWAREAVNELKQLGIMTGRDDNRFVPDAKVTRAEAVVTLMRYLEIIRED